MNIAIVWTGAALLLIAPAAAGAPTATKTEYLGPFAGVQAVLHPDNAAAPGPIAFYGTDLGFSYAHRGQLQFLFGDSWAIENYAPIEASTGARFDDGFGSVALADWPDPSRIVPGHIPLIRLGQNAGTAEMSAIDPGHAMDLGKTPMGGFSNGTREFGIFNLGKGHACTRDAQCGDGLSCDTGLGYFGVPPGQEDNLTLPCRDGTPACTPATLTDSDGAAVPDSGFCVDPTSSVGADPVSNVLSAMAFRVRIGLRSVSDARKYLEPHDWLTNKFLNVSVRTVQAFDPAGTTTLNDYAPAQEEGAARRVFLWGRPGFVGVNAQGRTLSLYFAYVDMPAGDGYAWKVHYYAGDEDGAPRFSTVQTDAVPLDLDDSKPGVQPEEPVDIVNQMSVAWVATLNKWVMFYGGGLTNLPSEALPLCGVTQLFTGAACKDVDPGHGAVHMRTADQPWGPWSAPEDVIAADPAAGATGQYGPGGALHHPDCTAGGCAPHSKIFVYHENECGFFYSANIIAQWIRPAGNGVDIIWNASTWDPYRVVLLRTHLEP